MSRGSFLPTATSDIKASAPRFGPKSKHMINVAPQFTLASATARHWRGFQLFGKVKSAADKIL
jgi:hypothetical protein